MNPLFNIHCVSQSFLLLRIVFPRRNVYMMVDEDCHRFVNAF